MNAKTTVFLIALAMVLTTTNAHARVVQQEQSWLDKIFSNDRDDMVQKSPFSQPQKRVQNPRQRQLQNQPKINNDEARTQSPKEPGKTPRSVHRNHKPQNDLSQNYADRIQTMRQQRMNALKTQQSGAGTTTGVND